LAQNVGTRLFIYAASYSRQQSFQLHGCGNLKTCGVGWIFTAIKYSNSSIKDRKFLNRLFRNLRCPGKHSHLSTFCFITVPSTAAVMGCASRRSLAMRQSCAARICDKRDTCSMIYTVFIVTFVEFLLFRGQFPFDGTIHRATLRIRNCPVSDLGPKTSYSDSGFS
jgi:hypothetical protein